MSITREEHAGDGAKGASGATGSNRLAFTFPFLKTEDIKVKLNGVLMAASTYVIHTTPSSAITFNTISPATAVQETTGAPKQGVNILIYRDTDVTAAKGVFSVGSSIRSVDLNNNQDQALFSVKEIKELVDDDLVRSTDTSWSTNDTEIASTAAINNRIASLDWDTTTLNSRIDTRADSRISAAATTASSSAAGSMSAADKTKLDAIEANADVTDATNVNAAGAIMNSDLDGKGELLVGDGSGDPTALPVGINGYILKADSSTGTGVVWAAEATASGEANVQADFNETDNTNDAFIKNKPTIPTNNNQLTNGAGYITATLTTEQVQDIVGAMFSGNTETNITATYQDADGTIDLVSTDTTTQLTTEEVQDIIGGMVSGNTETNIAVTYDDTSGKLNFASTDTNTTDLASDSSPQLAANLDVQANQITTSTTNGNLKIAPNGTGVVEIRGAGGADGTLQLNCSAQSHGIKLKSPPHSAAASYTLTFPNSIVTDGFLKTDANGNLSFATPDVVNDTSPQLGGDLQSNGSDIDFADNDKAIFGTGGDLEIYHNGTNSYIDNDTGDLIIGSGGTLRLVNADNSESYIKCINNGTVELYHDNTKKLETTTDGIKVEKIVTIDGSTPRIQMKPTADEQSHRIEFFNTADSIVSRIYGDPATGSLSLEVGTAGNETAVKCIKDAGVEIHHNGSKKLESTSDGAKITGVLEGDSNLLLKTCSGSISVILKSNNELETLLQATVNGSVELYHDNSKKLETTSTGVSVTGTISATSVATSANGIRNITTSTADPTSSDGANGDIWLKYTA